MMRYPSIMPGWFETRIMLDTTEPAIMPAAPPDPSRSELLDSRRGSGGNGETTTRGKQFSASPLSSVPPRDAL
jgi:hypothetical protein